MPRGLVYRLIDGTLFYMETDLCYYSVCNTLTVGVHISSTPSISGPASATERSTKWVTASHIFVYTSGEQENCDVVDKPLAL